MYIKPVVFPLKLRGRREGDPRGGLDSEFGGLEFGTLSLFYLFRVVDLFVFLCFCLRLDGYLCARICSLVSDGLCRCGGIEMMCRYVGGIWSV